MRPSEARNLRWRDIDIRKEKLRSKDELRETQQTEKDKKQARSAEAAKPQEQKKELEHVFVILNVRGKDKFRSLVAPSDVAKYLERVRAISKATGPDDFVFTTHDGTSSLSLYHDLIERLLTDSKLLYSSSKSRRSTYCFRHTYATYRLMEGVDVYFLAKQMGTSVKMIEDHYGHITPVKNAERILQGMPGWAPVAVDAGKETGA
jgi:integrase